MSDVIIQALGDSGLAGGENSQLARRPYIATHGKYKGHPVIAINTGQIDESGNSVYGEKPIQINNTTLRKDEWVNLDDAVVESARERLVVVDDLISGGLTHNVGGLGTLISEWEKSSEMTDAEITMDGESESDKDRQEFGLDGVPIPVIQKRFKIGERMLMASRQRGSSLDVTSGTEAARAVARSSESMVFNGANIGASNSAGQRYSIPGLLTFPGRATYTMLDWADENITPEQILQDILKMVKKLETEERRYGPFRFYVPGAYAFRFREDFKANSDKTLMQRVMDEDAVQAIRFSDVLPVGNVSVFEPVREVLDLAIASDLTTVQWQSGSGWTNNFQVFAAWAPRLKADYDSRTGILHASTA